jgi:hypothetical protein
MIIEPTGVHGAATSHRTSYLDTIVIAFVAFQEAAVVVSSAKPG